MRHSLNEGRREYVRLCNYLCSKCGTVLKGWCELDPDRMMHLVEKDFDNALRRIGFELGDKFSFKALWNYLDHQEHHSTHITVSVMHFDPNAAIEIAEFKSWCHSRAGMRCIREFQELTSAGDLKIDFDVLVAIIRQSGFRGGLRVLFQMMDRQNDGMIRPSDIHFYNRFDPPSFLSNEPNDEILEQFRTRLIDKFDDEPIRAWCTGLCQGRGSMRLCWRDFVVTYIKEAERTHHHSHSAARKMMADAASCWRSMDPELQGWVSVRRFSEQAFVSLLSFKQWCEKHHGSVSKAFQYMDDHSDGCVDAKRMRKFTAGGEVQDVDMLFFGLDQRGRGHLKEDDVQFLEEWDLDWEEEEGPLPQFRRKDRKSNFHRHTRGSAFFGNNMRASVTQRESTVMGSVRE